MNRFLLICSPEGDAGGAGGGSAGQSAGNAGGALAGTLLDGASGSAGAQGQAAGAGANGQAGGVVPEPFFRDWIGADGKINRAAYDRLPENLRPFKDTFAKYETVDQLLNGFGHSTTLNGKKGLMPLAPDAPESAKKEFNQRLREILHVPEKPEGYGIKKPQDLPDNLWDGKYVEGVQAIFHKHNIPPEAAAELIQYGANYGKSSYEEGMVGIEKNKVEARQSLEREWGAQMPKKLDLARRAALSLGLDPNNEIFNHPDVVKAMVRHAESVSEDKLVGANGGGVQTSKSFREEARSIAQDPTHPLHKAYRDPMHPNHDSVLAKVNELNAKAHAALNS